LYPGCSYGTYTFFVLEDSQQRNSKFTLQAVSPGDYFFIKYSLLELLAQYDKTLNNIFALYRENVKENGLPNCDFKVFRKQRNLEDIFVQVLRRQILLNR